MFCLCEWLASKNGGNFQLLAFRNIYPIAQFAFILLVCIWLFAYGQNAGNDGSYDVVFKDRNIFSCNGRGLILFSQSGQYTYQPDRQRRIFCREKSRADKNLDLIPLEIHADFEMAYFWIYNDKGFDFFEVINDSDFFTSLPEGIYSMFIGYSPSSHRHLILIKEDIDISKPVTIAFAKENATISNEYQFERENDKPLHINTIQFFLWNGLIDIQLNLTIWGIDSASYKLHYNKIPDYLTDKSEYSVKGKQASNDGNLYLLNNIFTSSERDTLITNNPVNFASADFNYNLPDSINEVSEKNILTFIPDFHGRSSEDPVYTSPIQQRIFQDTSAQLSLKSSRFWQALQVNGPNYDPYHYIDTPEIRFKNSKIYGYHFRDPDAPPFILSDNNVAHIGLGPTYWFGRFFNQADTVKIRSSYGMWEYLFLSQSNDVLRHYPIDYSIFQDDNLLIEGVFNLFFGPVALRLGFNPVELTIPLVTGNYHMVIGDNQNEIAGYVGISRVMSDFDLTKPDKNPPFLSVFQILSDNELANILDPHHYNEIRFILDDDGIVDDVEAFISSIIDTNWSELPLIYNKPYWHSELPLLDYGYYSLRIFAVDSAQNSIDCIMQPAFLVKDLTSIWQFAQLHNTDKMILKQNYPNPFNSITNIEIYIPTSRRANISVFNILGQKVKTLEDKYFSKGSHHLYWDAKNDHEVQLASGIYFLQLKGGDTILKRKVLYVK